MAEETLVNHAVAVVTDVAEEAVVAANEDVSAKEEEEADAETKAVIEDVSAKEEEEEEEVSSDVKLSTVVVVENNVSDEITSDEDNDLYPENEKKALVDLKELIRNALKNHEFIAPLDCCLRQPRVEEGPTQTDDNGEAETIVVEEEKEKEEKNEVATNDRPKEPVMVCVNEDGTKTVEAIEETIVSVVSEEPHDESSAASVEQEVKTTTEAIKEVGATSLLPPEEVSIWGVPLLKDERTDTILWKFLRARDFKVNEAFAMIKSTIKWRKEFKIDELLDEDLGDDLEKMVFMHGFSKQGHPVCYNVYGAFENKELYQKTFADEDKRHKFLKSRIHFLEKSIRNLDFSPRGISTMVQVNDLNNSPGPGKWELRQATKQALQLLQDNYPEFVAKQVGLFILIYS